MKLTHYSQNKSPYTPHASLDCKINVVIKNLATEEYGLK
ncbi:hypothetical protein ABI_13060 [Asticcacaulis biprosthecium C19]|uniref:Uncharacterized protein n=1 Tax=Asticcacaulis biprosthecium C19 TaxID=715226 RepID=F4QI01_9CAUL|nr:hypothetical protein ABI_13060 [Asticcacaulis biprosthecium C19]